MIRHTNQGQEMNSVLGRVVGVVAGLFLVIIGFSLLTPEAGLPQSGTTHALISVLTALGIGVIGASLLPNSLTLDGKEVKPLGIGLNASGGAAFFIITLIFLFYSADKKSEAQANTKVQQTEVAEPNPIPEKGELQKEEPKTAVQTDARPAPAATPQPVRKILYRYRTYCDTCCPAGPVGCPQYGVGQSYTEAEAASMAVDSCIANGGMEPNCNANVERY
jgi:hypothetical protein